MLFSATRVPTQEAWTALQRADLVSKISTDSRQALSGEIQTSDDIISLAAYAVTSLTRAECLSLWTELNQQALKQLSLDTLSHQLREYNAKQHSTAIALAIMRERLSDARSFGFETPWGLANAVAAAAEIFAGMYDTADHWMNSQGYFSCISQNVHGDLHISQTLLPHDTTRLRDDQLNFYMELGFSVPDKNTLVTGAGEVGEIATLNHWQDWSPLLGSLLVFARKIGASCLTEIRDYGQILESVERRTAHTTEALSGTASFGLQRYLKDCAVWSIHDPLEWFPISFTAHYGEDAPTYMAVIHDDKLWFPPMREIVRKAQQSTPQGGGGIECSLRAELLSILTSSSSNQTIVRFSQEDLPSALRATYRLFCRDPRRVEVLLRMFLTGAY